jgi:hypothetical protein
VVPHFAVVAGGAGLTVGHVALLDLGIDDPVVGTLEPLRDAAAEEGKGIAQHRTAGGDTIEGVDAGEAIGAGGKRRRKWRSRGWWLSSRRMLSTKRSPTCIRASMARSLATATVMPGGSKLAWLTQLATMALLRAVSPSFWRAVTT